jgi:hypothetical protein
VTRDDLACKRAFLGDLVVRLPRRFEFHPSVREFALVQDKFAGDLNPSSMPVDAGGIA